jgi:hypothetical protein
MAQLAIKGHEYRGKEVIEILEMLGGENSSKYFGDDDSAVYSIEGQEIVIYELEAIKSKEYNVFTLEEFLEKFPYKVGDKVKAWVNGYRGVFDIQDIAWDSIAKEVKYKIRGCWHSAENLQPYKEETMDRKYNVEEYLKVWKETEKGLEVLVNDKFELKEDNGKFFIIKKQVQYPKSYEGCCIVLSLDEDGRLYTKGYKASLIQDFHKLLICRDAYWKIAGEEMGLGKPWEPDWNNSSQFKDVIICRSNNIIKYAYAALNTILAFPTEEMRDAFYENFKDLIEECKEFL